MRRFITAGVVAGLVALGIAAAPVLASGGHTGRLGPNVQVINLHAAYLAHLGHTKPGKISGITYPRGKGPKVAPRRKATCTEPNCPMSYNGGHVQHSPHVYLLLWGPAWSSDSSQAASASYLEKFFKGLGTQPADNWSTTTDQYNDGSGHPSFSRTVYKGVFHDTSTPPFGVDQTQLAAEADAFASAHKIKDLTDAQIVIATQSGTCPQGFACGGSGSYCAWHSSSNEPYTNLPYMLDAGTDCGENFVNSGSAGIHDGFSMVGGHEYAETITDPSPDSGWIDFSDPYGGEIGDKCVWGGELWGGSDPYGNVTLSTGTFAMQSLWSNAAFTSTGNGCVMSTQVKSLKVTKSGTGASAGKVTSSPSGISCGKTCSAKFAGGTVVTLTAAHGKGAIFTGWKGACSGSKTSCKVTLSANKSVTASFRKS